MKKFASYIIGSVLLLSSAPAFAHTLRGNTLTPDGFCIVHQDGTIGVRFDGVSYTAWLAEYAADQIALASLVQKAEIDAQKNGGAPMTELQIGQLKAKVKKDAAALQRLRIDQGQAVLCK